MMRRICGLAAAAALAAVAAGTLHDDALSAKANDGVITGTVASADGAEAGVWVIAETDDWVAMSSEFRAIARLPGVEHAEIWEPEPSRIYAWSRAA